MILTQTAINRISKSTRLKLALALGFTEQWILKVIDKNKDNGPLTTAAAMVILREDTGLLDEEILETTKEAV